MSAISKKKQDNKSPQILTESPDEILQRKRALESRVGGKQSERPEPTGLAAEKAIGVLFYLPKSIHRLASRAAEDRDQTAKRFFFEMAINCLHQQGIITDEQHDEALQLPNEYGWKGRKATE